MPKTEIRSGRVFNFNPGFLISSRKAVFRAAQCFFSIPFPTSRQRMACQ